MAFVARPTEYGPLQSRDFKADGDWDVVADDFNELATAMGMLGAFLDWNDPISA